ncbi:MAG TPA: homoserine dehydrogenase [Vicinamibacterales bacterium]|nr:homoserine dehydrogenase [Vicinamibacterales bacterium]
MTFAVAIDAARDVRSRTTAAAPAPLNIALLGCGTVGSAFAGLAQRESPERAVRITHALMRDLERARPTLHADVARIDDGQAIFAAPPDVVVELLGGLEPARSLVLEALHRGIPVVTANKSLLAAHGAELREAAARSATPLLYEAAVLAGVPFLGTFARRPHAAEITGLVGIANGTSNYILTRARDERCGIETALADAQRLGLAEPDPAHDIDGIDAADKLAVLLQQFAAADVARGRIETGGIRRLTAADIDQARALGGTIKPVISADWSAGLQAFAGPAFVDAAHLLASVDGAENAVVLGGRRGRMVFRGPGAGPEVTAATVLDDVHEAAQATGPMYLPALRPAEPTAPETPWFIRVTAAEVPPSLEMADLLASHGVFLQRTHRGGRGAGAGTVAALTLPCARPRIERALGALAGAVRCEITLVRALEDR